MPVQTKIVAGQTYGLLTAIRPEGRNSQGKQLWLCSCTCGGHAVSRPCDVVAGRTKSCGCLVHPIGSDNPNYKHGLAQSREHGIWRGIHDRCSNSRNKNYAHYGGRGITVCAEWAEFATFFRDMGDSEGLELDRVDNNKGYSKENCRWTTRAVNNRNTRRSRRWFINGEQFNSLSQAAMAHGKDIATIAKWCHNKKNGAYCTTVEGVLL